MIYDRLRRIAGHFGCSIESFLKTTICLHDIGDWPAVDTIARTFFVHAPPALTVLQPSGLSFPGARIQIEAQISAG